MKHVSRLSLVLLLITSFYSCAKTGSSTTNNSNGNGKLSKIVIQSSSGGNGSLNFKYDNNGRLIRFYSSDVNGSSVGEDYSYTRNANGKIITESYSCASANVYANISYMLNQAGQYIYCIYTNNQSQKDSVLYEYTGDKITQTTTFFYNNGSYYSPSQMKYYYDNAGNLTSKESFNSSTNQWEVEYTSTYDSNLSPLELTADVIFLNNLHFGHNNIITETSRGLSISYNYTFGSNNRPSSAVVTKSIQSSPTTTENWTYYY